VALQTTAARLSSPSGLNWVNPTALATATVAAPFLTPNALSAAGSGAGGLLLTVRESCLQLLDPHTLQRMRAARTVADANAEGGDGGGGDGGGGDGSLAAAPVAAAPLAAAALAATSFNTAALATTSNSATPFAAALAAGVDGVVEGRLRANHNPPLDRLGFTRGAANTNACSAAAPEPAASNAGVGGGNTGGGNTGGGHTGGGNTGGGNTGGVTPAIDESSTRLDFTLARLRAMSAEGAPLQDRRSAVARYI